MNEHGASAGAFLGGEGAPLAMPDLFEEFVLGVEFVGGHGLPGVRRGSPPVSARELV